MIFDFVGPHKEAINKGIEKTIGLVTKFTSIIFKISFLFLIPIKKAIKVSIMIVPTRQNKPIFNR